MGCAAGSRRAEGDRDAELAGQVGIPQARPSTASAIFTVATFPRPAGSASPSFEGGQGGRGANDGAPCPGDELPLLPVAGTTQPGGEAPASEGDPRVRQVNQGNAAFVAMAKLPTPRDRDDTPRGRSEVPLTQPGATPATPGGTSSENGDTAGGAAATRGRRGRPRGSGRESRATGNGRGVTTNRGRIPRPGGSEPPSAPGSRGGSEPSSVHGEESELRKEEGRSEGGGPASGSVGRPRAFIDASQDGVMCGENRAAVSRGHRVVGLPCGHRHVMHARCVVEAIRRGWPHAQLICGTRGCTARHGRRESLKAAVQADLGLRVTVAGLGGRPDNHWGERGGKSYATRGTKTSLGIAGPLDDVSLEQLQQRFITVVRVQPGLPTTHAKLLAHVLGLLNHVLGAHRANRHSETPISLLRAIKLWYIVSAMLHRWTAA